MPMVPTYHPLRGKPVRLGTFYPRYGVYERIAFGRGPHGGRTPEVRTEIAHTVPGFPGEQWQMIYPQSSSCFREWQNLGFLETFGGVREERRLLGRPKGYLFTVWRDVGCCQDLGEIATTMAAISALELACKSFEIGGT